MTLVDRAVMTDLYAVVSLLRIVPLMYTLVTTIVTRRRLTTLARKLILNWVVRLDVVGVSVRVGGVVVIVILARVLAVSRVVAKLDVICWARPARLTTFFPAACSRREDGY